MPPSLSTWVQRAGRAGRAGQVSHAHLLVEPSIMELVTRVDSDKREPFFHTSHTKLTVTTLATFRKACDTPLRDYIQLKTCRQLFLDEYYDNPRKVVPGMKNGWLVSLMRTFQVPRLLAVISAQTSDALFPLLNTHSTIFLM